MVGVRGCRATSNWIKEEWRVGCCWSQFVRLDGGVRVDQLVTIVNGPTTTDDTGRTDFNIILFCRYCPFGTYNKNRKPFFSFELSIYLSLYLSFDTYKCMYIYFSSYI